MGNGNRFIHRVRGQEAHGVAFQHNAGQFAAEYRPGVDGDAVMAHDGRFHRRVAMHDNRAEIGLGIQERLAGPQQIVAGLALQGKARPDSGMDEGIAALPVHQDQPAQEVLMGLRD